MIITEKDLSSDQKIVYDAVLKWYKDKNDKLLIVGGFAGVGKTSVLACLAHKFDNTAYCCFTGKASLVLKNKLDDNKAEYSSVSTIHALIYRPIVDTKTLRVRGWIKRQSIDEDLIVIDEASMLDARIFRDLQSYNKKILAIGDCFQLFPVGTDINLMENPHLMLTQIHRQSQDNPIIKLSFMIRNDENIDNFECADNRIKILSKQSNELDDIILNMFKDKNKRLDNVVLCYFNASRVKINSIIRKALGQNEEEPQENDVVICLKNTAIDAEQVVFNGMRGLVESCYMSDANKYNANIMFPFDNIKINEYLCRYQFNNEKTFQSPLDLQKFGFKAKSWSKMGMLFDYGYALSYYKSQGSQFDNVVVFVERSKYQDDENFRRAIYTAVTRSSNNLVLVF